VALIIKNANTNFYLYQLILWWNHFKGSIFNSLHC